ncbi:MAG: peptidoglycan DD-metalloendopeptidase family protein [Ardenticatenales bacterium]|nr:peptidoglycan DD-metalloendopeptidase family protein [Ardenticatenales bacterium]
MCAFRFEAWPTEYRSINQYFGANPRNYAQFGLPGHEGLDIMAPTGSRIFAVAAGKVSRVHTNPGDHNYGIHVVVDHAEGYFTTYAHLQQALVSLGQEVRAGDVLGRANDTGNSFGSHLHLTLKQAGAQYLNWPFNIIDPTPFLLPLIGFQEPAGPYRAGWAYTDGLVIVNNLAQVTAGGINLRGQPSVSAPMLGLVPAGTILIITGDNRGQYTPVNVPQAVLGITSPPPPPAPPPPPTVATVDGWGFASYLTVSGSQAVVGQFGINLRQAPDRAAANIGLVQGGSTVTILGGAQGEYRPVRVRRDDFMGDVNLPAAPVEVPAGQPVTPPAGALLGWVATEFLTPFGNSRQALAHRFGLNLRQRPDQNSQKLGLVKGNATVTLAGLTKGIYTPVVVRQEEVLNLLSPLPAIEQPQPFPADAPPPPPPPQPVRDTTPGWAATAFMTIEGNRGIAGIYGINLRNAPRRNAANIGLVPATASMIITGPPQGEYTPVRVDDQVLLPPFDPQHPPLLTDTTRPPDTSVDIDPDPPALGQARIGLHASADPGDLHENEFAEFTAMRPGIIKVLSAHSGSSIARLAQAHPDATWIVRAFLDFGGRTISPDQFLNDTLGDTRRALDNLAGKEVVIELHNEPNLTPEGLGGAWQDGASFAQWWLELLRKYRLALPGRRFIYPGLSPGSAVTNLKQDHIQFVEASRAAVEAADGLGIHLYWSNVFPMSQTLTMLDDYISRFRFKPIWVTEASNNKAGTATHIKGRQYLDFWHELQQRPTVQGVTYFVASASNKTFREEIWVGRGIGRIVGRR